MSLTTRRTILKGLAGAGAGAATAVSGFPFVNRLALGQQSLKLGVVEASVVTESTVRVVVRECIACAGAHHAGEGMCHFEGGLIAGAVASIFKRPVRVRETTCLGGRGDDACRFEISFT